MLYGICLFSLSAIFPVFATDIHAGQQIASEVCSQCHGMRQPAGLGLFPSLAGRDPRRIRDALRQYRSKKRLSPIMNNLTGSLSNKEINNIAAYYSWVEVGN
ncbi:MAG: c-type cytochrome [Methyloprofundus sp.]|nr:c-type cytochrome [Methyloprofundus sp.]